MSAVAKQQVELGASSSPSADTVTTLVLDTRDTHPVSVRVVCLPPALLDLHRQDPAFDAALRSVLRVTVMQTSTPADESLPDVFGNHEVDAAGIRFTPHFPFDPGVAYRATYDCGMVDRSGAHGVLTLDFSLPMPTGGPAVVEQIFPSATHLPENILRFYVTFSRPMQRGHVEDQVKIVQYDGRPASDVLYRTPVELWDHSMKCLTILLDPGRLKRGVGPNRELGPPLLAGEDYMLVIGSAMSDLSGNPLGESIRKPFHVTEAVREPIAIRRWELVAPHSGSCEPIVLRFPRPLDWALLSNAIFVRANGKVIGGRIVIGLDEMQWCFTPTSPWLSGRYEVVVATALEDVCGNNLVGAFDRALTSDATQACANEASLKFRLA